MSIKRNHLNQPLGEAHHRAQITDDLVREMRRMYIEKKQEKARFGYSSLAKVFNCSRWTARDIVTYRTRYSA